MRSSFFDFSLPKTWARSSGPILQAQPEPCVSVVSRIFSVFVIIYLKKISAEFVENLLTEVTNYTLLTSCFMSSILVIFLSAKYSR